MIFQKQYMVDIHLIRVHFIYLFNDNFSTGISLITAILSCHDELIKTKIQKRNRKGQITYK